MIHWDLLLIDGYSDDKTMLYDLYINKNMKLDDLSKMLGVSTTTVTFRLRHHGINKGKGQYFKLRKEAI